MRLHRGGRFRAWLGRRLGGDAALGDRTWRRILHVLAAGALLYYLLPPRVLFGLPNEAIPLLALAAVATLEALRLTGRLEVPVLRSYERGRPASYAYFGLAIVLSVLLFPEPIAVAVVLGTAIVDPIAGEVRGRGGALYPWVPFGTYAVLAFAALASLGGGTIPVAAGLALLSAGIAIAVEAPSWAYLDDDLAMTLVPGVVLTLLALAVPGLL